MILGATLNQRLHVILEIHGGEFVNDFTSFEVFAHILVIILSCSLVCFIQASGGMFALRQVYQPSQAAFVTNKTCKKYMALQKLHSHLLEKRQLNIPFDHLLFAIAQDRNLLIHPLWTKISLDVSPTYPPASPSAEQSLQYAFVDLLNAFFSNKEMLNRSDVYVDHLVSDKLPEVTMKPQNIWDQNRTNKVHRTCDYWLCSKVLFAESFW